MAGSDIAEELKRQLREKEQEIHGQNQLLQNSTMLELLDACHKHFDTHFTVEHNPEKTTAGTITKPEGRKHPAWLRPLLGSDLGSTFLAYSPTLSNTSWTDFILLIAHPGANFGS